MAFYYNPVINGQVVNDERRRDNVVHILFQWDLLEHW